MSVPADHPGWTAPGRPHHFRSMCSFCPAFFDFAPFTDPAEMEQVLQAHLEVHVEEMVTP